MEYKYVGDSATADGYAQACANYKGLVSYASVDLKSLVTSLTLIESSIGAAIGYLNQASTCFSNGAYNDGVEDDVGTISEIVGKLSDALSEASSKLTESSTLSTAVDSDLSASISAIEHWNTEASRIAAEEAAAAFQ